MNLLPPLDSGPGGCAICARGRCLDMQDVIAVGFGDASVTCDDRVVYQEEQDMAEADLWTGQQAEDAAAKDPDHDWRVHLVAPLYEAVYQRHGAGHWPLVEKGLGFA